MLKRGFHEPLLRWSVLAFCVAWLLYMMLHHRAPLDVGDGIMHYFISQASWEDPHLFLDHWGKPVFILLSSPFSQFGFNGVVVFNIIVFTGTVLLGYHILMKKGVTVWLQVLFPLVLLKAHDVAVTVLAGLTEPLFNLAIIASLYFLLERKFLWFALLVSFLPFMRSEGQLPLLLALFLLIYFKAYRSIPWLLTGFVIYAIAGVFVYHDFWWYFTKSPYSMGDDIYGKGSWMHYLLSYKSYLGNPGLYVFMIGIPAMLYFLVKRDWKTVQMDWLFYAGGVFFGVLASHSYFWATGQNGSLGLTRIATQGMPSFLLLQCYYIGNIKFFNGRTGQLLLSLASAGLVFSHVKTRNFPQIVQPLDQQVLNAADYLKTLDLRGKKVFYHFPLLSFAYGENDYSRKEKTTVMYTCNDLSVELSTMIKPGDLLVRDSHFGPVDMRLPQAEVLKHPELVKIKEFISSEQVDDPNGETEGVVIYQYIPVDKQFKLHPVVKELHLNKTFDIKADSLYSDIHRLLPAIEKDTKVTVTLESDKSGFILTYDYNHAQDYSNVELKEGETVVNTYLFHKFGETKLFIWNPERLSGKVRITDLRLETVEYHPFLKDQR